MYVEVFADLVVYCVYVMTKFYQYLSLGSNVKSTIIILMDGRKLSNFKSAQAPGTLII